MENLKPIFSPQFEVEIRCHFDSADDAYKTVPFLHSCLRHEMIWSSSIYGQEFFKAGKLLRVSKTTVDNKTQYYLGWKGCDTGTFANIREEIDEVITAGITGSEILRKLGAQNSTLSRKDITAALKFLGYQKFMSFRGYDLFGDYKPLNVSMKLLNCRSLKWPVLLEIEKAAKTREDALIKEAELHDFCDRFGLHDRLVREEPPTLLYAALFGGKIPLQVSNAWDGIYRSRGVIATTPHQDMPAIVHLLKDRTASTILDLGSGTGRHLIYLARNGFTVFGLDNSPEAIALSRKWLTDEGLSANLQLQSMYDKLPFGDSFFDAVISVQAIHHADILAIRQSVKEITRVLKSGGFLFVTVPKLVNQARNYRQIEPNTLMPVDGMEKGLPHHYFTPDEMREVFAEFNVTDIHLDDTNHYCLWAFKR